MPNILAEGLEKITALDPAPASPFPVPAADNPTPPPTPQPPPPEPVTLATSRSYLAPEIKEAQSHSNEPSDQMGLDLQMHRLKESLQQEDTSGKAKLDSYIQFREKRGEKPFQYLEPALRREENRNFQTNLENCGILFSGPQNYEKAFPEDQRQQISADFSSQPNPEEARKSAANRLGLSRLTGTPIEQINADWPLLKSRYAQQALQWKGTGEISEDEFYTTFGDKIRTEITDRQTMEKMAGIGQYAAIRSRSYSEAKAEAQKQIGADFARFEPALKSAYAGILADHSDDELRNASTLFDYRRAQEGVTGLSRKEALSLGPQKIAEKRRANDDAKLFYAQADQAKRDRMMGLMGIMAQNEGVALSNFDERSAAALSSGIRNVATGTTALIGDLGSSIYHTIANNSSDPATAARYRRTAHLANVEEILDSDFRTSGVKVARYMDDKREGFWDTVQDTTLMAIESAPLMAVAATPYVGLPVATSTFAQQNKSELRRTNPNMPEWERNQLAYSTGFAQAIIEKVQVKTIGARLNATSGLLLQMGKTGALGAGLFRIGVNTAAETIQEVGQDLLLPAFTQVAAAADSDIKGPDWHAVIDREKQSVGDIARVSLLLTLVGGVGSTVSDYASLPDLKKQLTDTSLLRLHGLSEIQATELSTLADKNTLAAADQFKDILEKAKPEERQANSQAEKDRLIAAAENTPTPSSAGIPEILPGPNGRALVRWNNTAADEQLFETPEQAHEAILTRAAEENIDLTRMNREGLAGIMDAAREKEVQRLEDATGSHIQVDIDNKAPLVPFSQWVGESKTRLEQARERVRLELRQAANDMNLTVADQDIDLDQWFTLGSSTNSYQDGITTIAIKLATGKGSHPGATPLDSIQEFSEGISKHLRDQAGVPWEKQVQWIRDTEAFTKRGFLQDDLSDLSEPLRHQAIDEAFSSIAVGYATGRIMETQVPSALRSFLKAFKQTLGHIFSLAKDIKAYSESTSIDPQFKQYLDLATGFSEDTSLGKPSDTHLSENTDLSVDPDLAAALAVPTFSIAPSSPERDARTIEPLVISSEALPGGKKDWHKAVRDYIGQHLVGKSLINKDTGKEIRFTSLSKREAPSKLRREQAFRASQEIDTITLEALHLGFIPPNKSGLEDIQHYDYFALPVEIDGQSATAWFNTRQKNGEDHSTFYEFGLHQPKKALGFQNPSEADQSQQLGSKPRTTNTVGSFLSEIKHTLPAAIKLAAEQNPSSDAQTNSDTSFSIASVPSFIRPLDNTHLTNDSTSHERQRDPAHILQSIRDSASGSQAQGDDGGNASSDSKKRRKHGRQLASGAELAQWAKENKRELTHEPFVLLAESEIQGGGEHRVFTDESTQRIVKLTKPGLFGAQAEDAGAYLERWALHNKAFNDDVTFEGLVTLPGEDAPRAVISQAFAEGRDATEQEQYDYLIAKGFHEMPDGKWIHPIRAIQAWDTITPGNAIMTADGVRIVDLQMAPADPKELAALRQKTGIGRETSFSIAPIGPGPKPITEAPKPVSLSNPFPDHITQPSELRKEFWKNFDTITKNWPKVIDTPEGPIAWSKGKAGHKLKFFKDGEPAMLHFIAAAHLPELLANSKLASVEPELKNDHTVEEIHRRYSWATFPNGQKRHILLTVERMSDRASEKLQSADQAYSSEVLGISLEILPQNKSADVVTLQAGDELNPPHNMADTPTHKELTHFLSGIKPEHRHPNTNSEQSK